MADDDFLKRWSRRKIEARKGQPGPAAEPAPAPAPRSDAAPAASVPAPATESAPPPLPPVDSLTADSDFAPFMRPEVDAGLRRAALKKLLHDPRFNVMDGLDVYIDDYTKADPLPEGWLEKMNQYARLGDGADREAKAREEAERAAQAAAPGPPAESVEPLPAPGPVPGEEEAGPPRATVQSPATGDA